MPAPTYITWVGDPDNGVNPYRPSAEDLGGTDKQNDADYPPEPGDPTAEEWNQAMGQIAGLSLLSPAALIDVRFSGGTPSVYAVYSPNSELDISDITVTDVGTGIVTLGILATKIPDPRFGGALPQATGNNTGVGFRSAAQTLRCEIRTGGALADVNFLAVWG